MCLFLSGKSVSQDLFPGTPAPEAALSLPALYRELGPQGKAPGIRLCTELGSWLEAAFAPPFAILPPSCPACIWANGQMNSIPDRSVGALWVGSVRKVEDLLQRQGQREEAPLPSFSSQRDTEQRALTYLCSHLFSAGYQLSGSMVHPQNLTVK